jgi:hypothetical protein
MPDAEGAKKMNATDDDFCEIFSPGNPNALKSELHKFDPIWYRNAKSELRSGIGLKYISSESKWHRQASWAQHILHSGTVKYVPLEQSKNDSKMLVYCLLVLNIAQTIFKSKGIPIRNNAVDILKKALEYCEIADGINATSAATVMIHAGLYFSCLEKVDDCFLRLSFKGKRMLPATNAVDGTLPHPIADGTLGAKPEGIKEKVQSANIIPWEDTEKTITKYAHTSFSILLHGEPGTGKSYLASEIHKLSERSGSFKTYSCGFTNDPNRIRADLFGHVKGSFTDAKINKDGLATLAKDGTLFLDEIGDLPEDAQASLLMFLQDDDQGLKSITPIGGETFKCDVRIIAAMNKPLKTLRKDLLGRFPVKLTLPPLRECRERIRDLSLLLFTKHAATVPGKKNAAFTKTEATILVNINYNWPGNVRQLDHAVKLALTDKTISGNNRLTQIIHINYLKLAA